MEGISNVLLSLGVACIMEFVFGYIASVSTTIVFGMVVLCIYGIFWMTKSHIIVLGTTFYYGYHKSILVYVIRKVVPKVFHPLKNCNHFHDLHRV